MEKRPKVSVIIPVYNVEKYIRRCMDSVTGQTLQDIEIIVVNDGSPDHSAEIVREYMEKDKRISLIEKKNGGLSSARNAGMREASGQVIMFLDSDDYLHIGACEKVYRVFEEEKPDIIVFGANVFPRSPEPDRWLLKKTKTRDCCYSPFKPAALIREAGGSPFAWNKAYSAEFLKRVQVEYAEKVRYGEDLIFCFQVFPAAGKIRFIHERLYCYRWCRPESLMNTMAKEKTKLLKNHMFNLQLITHYWYKKNWLKRWRISYEIWFLYFLLPDILSMDPDQKTVFSDRLLMIMNRYKLRSRWAVRIILYVDKLKEKIVKR